MTTIEYEYDKILYKLLDNYTIKISPTKNTILYDMILDELDIQYEEQITGHVKLHFSEQYPFSLYIELSNNQKYILSIDSNNNAHVFTYKPCDPTDD